MKYNIYMGGYQEMDSAYAPPHLVGSVEAISFKEACRKFFVRDEDSRYFTPDTTRYWALRLGPTMCSVCDDYPIEQWKKDIET